ncbi:MAG TPA: TIGR03364 family FAD-dependent oxidoreductase [Cyclobacteriaceae bacterium]|nr:TIGR03364 family FAD-dependent oxidoreductase [Cyclobacteriaceae bacterium]
MNQHQSADIAIVGGGIVGLAHAYMALERGYRVVLFEREQFAIGASVRNFGLVWPIGQEPGEGFDRALRSREHWMNVAREAGLWINQNGSLHLAYHEDELEVLQEFVDLYGGVDGYQCTLLSADQAKNKSSVVKTKNLKGALWSGTECTVNPREAIRRIPKWLAEKYGLILRFGEVVKSISLPKVETSRETWKVDKVYVCSGADFETLYPDVYDRLDITKCKLQMMKAAWRSVQSIGPSLCAGLTLRHYAAFNKCTSLSKLDKRYDKEEGKLKENGIHVLLAQNNAGELIIGDSHHYQLTHEPFDSEEVNQMILTYLTSFAEVGDIEILERWHGIYPKLNGSLNLLVEPEPGVTVVNCLGGAGMTLSFGLAEEILERDSNKVFR